MKNGIPDVYWGFRYAWSAVHLLMVLILAVWLAAWLLHDNRGADIFNDAYVWVQDLSDQLASAVSFPWS